MLLRASRTGLDEPVLVPFGRGATLAAWDGPGDTGAPQIFFSGAPAQQRATLRLALADDRVRFVVAARAPDHRAEAELRLDSASLGGDTGGDPSALLEGLSGPDRARLAAFLLAPARAAARPDGAAHAAFCRAFLRAAGPAPGAEGLDQPALAAARLFNGTVLYVAPGSPGIGAISSTHILGERVHDNPYHAVLAAGDGGTSLLLAVPSRCAGAEVVIVGAAGFTALQLASPQDAPAIAVAAAGGLSATLKAYALRCLALHAGEPRAEAEARALQAAAGEPGRPLQGPGPVQAGLDFAASCGEAGIFVRGWLHDPHGIVERAELLSPFGEADIATSWRRLARADLKEITGKPGFVALARVEEPLPVLQRRLRLTTPAGTLEAIQAPVASEPAKARDAVLSSVPAHLLDDRLLDDILGPAAAALHARAMARQAPPEVVEIGPQTRAPEVSFIIPLYRNLSFLRLQTAAFSIDPDLRHRAELVYVLDSPEQRAELEHLLHGLTLVTGLGFRLVVMSANFGYAAANNTGVQRARGRVLLLLNSDVVPIAPGWLSVLLAALEPSDGTPVGAVGPKLLFDDGSLQHAGLTFARDPQGRWYNTHFFKGYPRFWPAACVARSTPGVTGAAFLVPRALYEDVGGLCEDYVIGDYEDSDLCLKLRANGRDVRYEPRAELHHFERRSIRLHAGYARTAASAYNRRLHAERWSAAMEEVVRECGEETTR